MGRLTLNVLLSFAQFEREVTGERIRDKIAASKKKGMWMGGWVPIGYDAKDRTLVINEPEAKTVRTIFRLYTERKNVRLVQSELHRRKLTTKRYVAATGRSIGGLPFSRGHIYRISRTRSTSARSITRALAIPVSIPPSSIERPGTQSRAL